jgi:hypothetical protein
MRKFGLIVVNPDGFGPSAGGPPSVFRAVQNVQALANSSVAADATVNFTANGRNPNPPERLGWAGRGATGTRFSAAVARDNSRRSFADRRAAGAARCAIDACRSGDTAPSFRN